MNWGLPHECILTAPELRDCPDPDIDWVINNLLGKGVLTIMGGKPKCGKTTLLFGAVYAMQLGVPFMGLQTRPARTLFITEQSRKTIRPKLGEYGLLDCADLHLMFPRQMLGFDWAEIIEEASEYSRTEGMEVVVVDTVNDLCHLENTFSDSEWLEAINPLQGLAQTSGMAVLGSFHAKKEVASLVDMFRGSNAIVGKADIVLGLSRDGSGDHTVRTIEGMSRLSNGFDEQTRIVRKGLEYVTIGSAKEVALQAKIDEYIDLLPSTEDAAMTRGEIADALDVSAATVTTYLKAIENTGRLRVAERPGRGNAKVYWIGGDS